MSEPKEKLPTIVGVLPADKNMRNSAGFPEGPNGTSVDDQWRTAIRSELKGAGGNVILAIVRASRKHPELAKAVRGKS